MPEFFSAHFYVFWGYKFLNRIFQFFLPALIPKYKLTRSQHTYLAPKMPRIQIPAGSKTKTVCQFFWLLLSSSSCNIRKFSQTQMLFYETYYITISNPLFI